MSILQSIKPQYCELIASGKKTIEVRKTRPKIETPFKVYIYCTKDKIPFLLPTYSKGNLTESDIWQNGNGKVIGEYVCDEIKEYRFDALQQACFMRKVYGHSLDEEFTSGTCISYKEAHEYCKNLKYDCECTDMFYGWHISDLVIYDNPKELSEFYKECTEKVEKCKHCKQMDKTPNIGCDGLIPLTRPPQSWCYVEEV